MSNRKYPNFYKALKTGLLLGGANATLGAATLLLTEQGSFEAVMAMAPWEGLAALFGVITGLVMGDGFDRPPPPSDSRANRATPDTKGYDPS